MPPCLRVSSPKISVCSHLPFQVRYIFPITKLYLYAAPFLLPNPLNRPKESHAPYIHSLPLKRWSRQHNCPKSYPTHTPITSQQMRSIHSPMVLSTSSLYSLKNAYHISVPLPFPCLLPTQPAQTNPSIIEQSRDEQAAYAQAYADFARGPRGRHLDSAPTHTTGT